MKKTLLFFALLGMVMFTSCDKKGWDKEDYDKEEWDKEDWGDKEEGCFDLVYPVSYTMPDGSTITGDDKEGLWTAIKAWYDAHSDVEAKAELQYPVNVLFKDGETMEVDNEDEMAELKEGCEYGKEDWECFDLVYPVSYTMSDGSTITGDDEEGLWTAIKAWYDAHPDVEAKPSLEYPVSVMFYDEETKEVANEEEMIDLKKDCEWGKDWECFDLVFPVTFTMPDDTTISGADKEEVWTAIKAWYEAHPDVEAKPTLQYPVDIMFEDGSTQAIANEDEMATAKDECED